MTEFEYLSVLVSIIIGLGLSHLLAGTARLVQRRDIVRWYAPTVTWLVLLFLIQVQIWWAAYDAREAQHWHFFAFLSFLLIPVFAFFLTYLLVPDFERSDAIDLRASFHANRPWFYGVWIAAVMVSLTRDIVSDGAKAFDLDAWFRVGFIVLGLIGASTKRDRAQLVIALAMAAAFVGYVLALFLRLR